MSVTDINLVVLKDTAIDGVPVRSGDYYGLKYARSDANSSGGFKTSYELILPQPIPDSAPTTGRIDITDLIALGAILILP